MSTWKAVAISAIQIGLVGSLVNHHIKLKQANARLRTAAELTRYLSTMIDQGNVPMTQFDQIAISTILSK